MTVTMVKPTMEVGLWGNLEVRATIDYLSSGDPHKMKTINISLWSELRKGLQLFTGDSVTSFLLPCPRVVLRWTMSDYIGGEGLSNREAREDSISVTFTSG